MSPPTHYYLFVLSLISLGLWKFCTVHELFTKGPRPRTVPVWVSALTTPEWAYFAKYFSKEHKQYIRQVKYRFTVKHQSIHFSYCLSSTGAWSPHLTTIKLNWKKKIIYSFFKDILNVAYTAHPCIHGSIINSQMSKSLIWCCRKECCVSGFGTRLYCIRPWKHVLGVKMR